MRRLGTGKVLGTETPVDRPGADEPRLLQAEQALVDVVAGCREGDAARVDLQPYIDWLQLHPLAGRDLEIRAPAFLAWLKPKAPPG